MIYVFIEDYEKQSNEHLEYKQWRLKRLPKQENNAGLNVSKHKNGGLVI